MDKIWIAAIAIGSFLIFSFLFYQLMKGYVKESFGKKWLTVWGNKVYFWQSLIFMSASGTALLLILLKWADVLSF